MTRIIERLKRLENGKESQDVDIIIEPLADGTTKYYKVVGEVETEISEAEHKLIAIKHGKDSRPVEFEFKFADEGGMNNAKKRT